MAAAAPKTLAELAERAGIHVNDFHEFKEKDFEDLTTRLLVDYWDEKAGGSGLGMPCGMRRQGWVSWKTKAQHPVFVLI